MGTLQTGWLIIIIIAISTIINNKVFSNLLISKGSKILPCLKQYKTRKNYTSGVCLKIWQQVRYSKLINSSITAGYKAAGKVYQRTLPHHLK